MCGFPLRPAWAEINLAAIGHNVRQFKNHLSPKTSIMAIVKADGYGHGAVEVARAAVAAGVSFLGVGLVEEAVQLRENGFDVPILILGFTPAEYAPYLCQYKLTPSVFTLEEADAFARAARNCAQTLAVHVAVDTGMGRVGCFPCEKADGFIAHLAALQGLVLQGIYTHFASADQSDKSFACWQLKRFNDLVHRLAAQGIHIPVKHTANSAASIDLPEAHFEMVRIGISLYGLYPSAEVERSAVALRPAMSLKARIIFTKDIPAGTGVSYGSTYVANRLERIATLPLGYGDGYPRKLSNVGQVLVRGKRAPIVGRVCMDQTMINVQDIGGVLAGEEAVLFGRQGKALLHVDEVAGWLDTINYELVTRISGRIPRVYVWED
ncbi:MAG: alanine racemase [Dethiobacter sp.]|nr:alanine racemase [Dethiobacter sp.]MBS3897620.1 alanine racemase [Dethiobacter sp.]MBS3983414.1 alanine racemase [Dethiobacter sp.]MCL4463285.1 alanine racemase [Bacillota bacterium]MCL5993033.1 alanine racemase [Bacillota bacterium]